MAGSLITLSVFGFASDATTGPMEEESTSEWAEQTHVAPASQVDHNNFSPEHHADAQAALDQSFDRHVANQSATKAASITSIPDYA